MLGRSCILKLKQEAEIYLVIVKPNQIPKRPPSALPSTEPNENPDPPNKIGMYPPITEPTSIVSQMTRLLLILLLYLF